RPRSFALKCWNGLAPRHGSPCPPPEGAGAARRQGDAGRALKADAQRQRQDMVGRAGAAVAGHSVLVEITGLQPDRLARLPADCERVAHPVVPRILAPVGVVENEEALMAGEQAEVALAQRERGLDVRAEAIADLVAGRCHSPLQPKAAR